MAHVKDVLDHHVKKRLRHRVCFVCHASDVKLCQVKTLPDVVTEWFVETLDFQNPPSLHKHTRNFAVSIANFLIVAHPGTRQVLLLHPLSTPCARLELLWPALCTGAVLIKRWLTTVVSTNVEPESSKSKAQDFCALIRQLPGTTLTETK